MMISVLTEFYFSLKNTFYKLMMKFGHTAIRYIEKQTTIVLKIFSVKVTVIDQAHVQILTF